MTDTRAELRRSQRTELDRLRSWLTSLGIDPDNLPESMPADNRDLRHENDVLRRQLERANYMGRAAMSPGGFADEIQRQRDALSGAMSRAEDLAEQRFRDAQNSVSDAPNHQPPANVNGALVVLINQVISYSEDATQTLAIQLKETGEVDPFTRLTALIRLAEITGGYHAAIAMINELPSLVQPECICAGIIWECEHSGGPSLSTIRALDQTWMTDNLGPDKYEVLHDALNHAWSSELAREQGKTLKAYASEQDIGEKTLDRYRGYFTKIEGYAEAWQKKIPQQVEGNILDGSTIDRID